MLIDNLIVIKGGAYKEIRKALVQWIDMYSDIDIDGLTFHLYKNGRANHIIQADQILDNERFYYLVNYLKYPQGIDYKVEIEGYTIGKDENILSGKDLLVYIPVNDQEYDNVFVVTSENENFKVDINGKISDAKEKKPYKLPDVLNFDHPETIIIDHNELLKKEGEQNVENLNKRFVIVSILILFALTVNFLFFRSNEIFFKANEYISYGVWAWLFLDYKLLQNNKLYLYSLFFTMMICLYGHIVFNEFSNGIYSSNFLVTATMPTALLIVQRILRVIFITILNREPVVDNPLPSIYDFVYIIILVMLSFIIPFYLYD